MIFSINDVGARGSGCAFSSFVFRRFRWRGPEWRGWSGQTAEFAWPDLYQDREGHLNGSSANRIVEQFVDGRLPFQLPGLIRLHRFDHRRAPSLAIRRHAVDQPWKP